MRVIEKHQKSTGRGIVEASDNTRTNTKKQAELAYQNRTRTKLQFLKETADKKAEQAVKEREVRRKDPEYDEKKRKVQVAEQLKQNDDGKYTSKKKTFVGRFADNLYHNSGASYYVNRAKELAKEGATPLEQTANAGLGLLGTAVGSVIGGVDAIGKGLGSDANVGTATMGLLAETPIGGVPMTLMDAGRQLGGSRGENVAELLATVMPGGRIGRTGRATSTSRAVTASRAASRDIPPIPVQLEAGQTKVPTVYINSITGEPSYRWATPNPNQSSWRFVGANLFDEPMSQAEIAEAVRNRTLRIAFQNGNIGGIWRNIDHNGGIHVQMRQRPNGGRFPTGTIYLPDGQIERVSPSVARQYLNGTRRYPSLLSDAETQRVTSNLRGVSTELAGYGIDGPRYRVNYGQGRSSVYRYPEIQSILNSERPLRGVPLKEALQGITDPDEILATKWKWSEKNANNPELIRSIRQVIESGQDTSPILSGLSNKQIDFLVDNGMLNKSKHTGNMVGVYDSGEVRPFSPREVLESVEQDWAKRKRGSVFDFATTNSYSYQSYLLALKNLAKRIENGEARILKPGDRKIQPNDYASIEFISPETGEKITYPRKVGINTYGSGYGRAGGAMRLDVLNNHYKKVYEKLNTLGRKQYGTQWTDVIWEDITPQQLIQQYENLQPSRFHHDWRMLIYKNGGKPQLYNRRLISKIKGL